MSGRLVFEHATPAQRVLFGAGMAAAHLAEEVRGRDVLAVVTARSAAVARHLLGDVPVVAWFDEVAEHVPVATAARARAAAVGAELLVAVGGGSAIGVAKAAALTTGLPIVAVPTTYAGSEATDVWGVTEGGVKRTGTDSRVLPGTVIYDPELTLSLPVGLSVASGLNALAHGVETLWGPRADPINAALAVEGIRLLGEGLPEVVRDPAGLRGREQVLCGAHLAAAAFASAGTGLHHRICHVLGGRFGLPHAPTHAAVLPHVLAFNAPAAPKAAGRVVAALRPGVTGSQAGDAVAALAGLYARLDAPRALRDLGLAEDDLEEAARLALAAVPPSNPRGVGPADMLRLLRAAWAGDAPQADETPRVGDAPQG